MENIIYVGLSFDGDVKLLNALNSLIDDSEKITFEVKGEKVLTDMFITFSEDGKKGIMEINSTNFDSLNELSKLYKEGEKVFIKINDNVKFKVNSLFIVESESSLNSVSDFKDAISGKLTDVKNIPLENMQSKMDEMTIEDLEYLFAFGVTNNVEHNFNFSIWSKNSNTKGIKRYSDILGKNYLSLELKTDENTYSEEDIIKRTPTTILKVISRLSELYKDYNVWVLSNKTITDILVELPEFQKNVFVNYSDLIYKLGSFVGNDIYCCREMDENDNRVLFVCYKENDNHFDDTLKPWEKYLTTIIAI